MSLDSKTSSFVLKIYIFSAGIKGIQARIVTKTLAPKSGKMTSRDGAEALANAKWPCSLSQTIQEG